MTGHNDKIFSCTAQVQTCIWAVLEIKLAFEFHIMKKDF